MHQKNPIFTSFSIIHFPLFLYSEPLWMKSKVAREPLTYAGASQWLRGRGSDYDTGDKRGMGSIPGLGRFPEKEMATHPSVIGWEIPWTGELGGLRSMSLQSIRRDYTYTHTCTHTSRCSSDSITWSRAKSFVVKNLINRSQHISSFWPAL